MHGLWIILLAQVRKRGDFIVVVFGSGHEFLHFRISKVSFASIPDANLVDVVVGHVRRHQAWIQSLILMRYLLVQLRKGGRNVKPR